MSRHLRLGLLWLLGPAAAGLLLYGALLGFRTLAGPPLDVQMHNTYFVVTPAQLWLTFSLVLGLLSGSAYLLLTRLPRRTAAWVVGLTALVLLALTGSLLGAVGRALGGSYFGAARPTALSADGFLTRLLGTLRVLQVGLGAVALLAGIKLGRSRRP
jgi:hypothetical protein